MNGDASKTALDSQLRRICCPKPASGKLEVSAEIYRQWKAGGAQRKLLLDQLVKCNGDKEIYAVNHAVIKHKLLYALQTHELLMYLRVCIYLYKWSTVLKEQFKKHIEHMQKKSRRNNVHVEKGFYTKEKMKTALSWSKSRS